MTCPHIYMLIMIISDNHSASCSCLLNHSASCSRLSHSLLMVRPMRLYTTLAAVGGGGGGGGRGEILVRSPGVPDLPNNGANWQGSKETAKKSWPPPRTPFTSPLPPPTTSPLSFSSLPPTLSMYLLHSIPCLYKP